ncbi:MAG TPA: hypothetical protein VG944_08410 [Fimbriimonas sp.]|nr:hypothetical protein [Fimbriimonas sp.]
MVIPVQTQEKVIVNKNGQTFEGVTHHYCHQDIPSKEGPPIKGDLLGIGILDDRGFITYAQHHQLMAVE